MALSPEMVQLIALQKQTSCASLAAGIIAASGRNWSVQQALELEVDIYFAKYPEPASGRYQTWMNEKDKRLNKVHGLNG